MEKKQQMICSSASSSLSSQVVQLPVDLIFKIFLLLPGKLLLRLRSVCKEWLNLIDSTTFVNAHIRHCGTALVFMHETSKKASSFSIEENALSGEPVCPISERLSGCRYGSYINFFELQDWKVMISESNITGLGNILASCNGLLLLTLRKNQGLVVLNPITRKLTRFPLGTIVDSTTELPESYGFLFSNYTSEYKVVHLFRDKLGYVGCEILSLTTRSWHSVDGPRFGLFHDFKHKPVDAAGAWHWLPRGDGSVELVSLSVTNEKFCTRALPISSTVHDRILEFQGSLSFITHVSLHEIQIWRLNEEKWTKQYTIDVHHDVTGLVPIFTSRNCREMVFSGLPGYIHVYDFKAELLKIVVIGGFKQLRPAFYVPHLDTLASW